jgi:uncharacterized tellurite resistance protein B-like protein
LFDAIKNFVADLASGEKQAGGLGDHDFRVATAALLVHAAAVDLYHFTHLLNASLDDNDRLRMVEMMWKIAYADGEVSEYEDNLIWRVADLLGVSSTERIALRHRVANQSGKA